MKNKIKAIFSFCVFILILTIVIAPLTVSAEEDIISGTQAVMRSGVTYDDKYVVYEKPSSSSKVLGTYKAGQKVTIAKKTMNDVPNLWYYITYPIKGWIFRGNLDVNSPWVPINGRVETGKVSGAWSKDGVKQEYAGKDYNQISKEWTCIISEYKTIPGSYSCEIKPTLIIKKFKTVFNPTGCKYSKRVKEISKWVRATNMEGWKSIETQKKSEKLSGEVNLGFDILGIKLGGSLKGEYTVEATTVNELTIDRKSLNNENKYCLCYWVSYLEYEAVTYEFNEKTQKYDIKINELNNVVIGSAIINGKTNNKIKVSGKFNAVYGNVEEHLAWDF